MSVLLSVMGPDIEGRHMHAHVKSCRFGVHVHIAGSASFPFPFHISEEEATYRVRRNVSGMYMSPSAKVMMQTMTRRIADSTLYQCTIIPVYQQIDR